MAAELGITNVALAARAGISEQVIYNWKFGRCVPQWGKLLPLMQAVGLDEKTAREM